MEERHQAKYKGKDSRLEARVARWSLAHEGGGMKINAEACATSYGSTSAALVELDALVAHSDAFWPAQRLPHPRGWRK